MSGVEGSSGTAGESEAFEGVCAGTGEAGAWAGGPAKREPRPTALGDN